MKLPLWLTTAVGAVGVVAAYLVTADPPRAAIYQVIAGLIAALVPVAHKAVS